LPTSGSSTWFTRLRTLPTRLITHGAFVAPMLMIWLTSRLKVKPSRERTVIVLSFSSSRCDSVRALAQFNTMFVVGTSSTRIVRRFSGCLPG
jgi:hypothetical protein